MADGELHRGDAAERHAHHEGRIGRMLVDRDRDPSAMFIGVYPPSSRSEWP